MEANYRRYPNIKNVEELYFVTENEMFCSPLQLNDIVPILYQYGYLTIKGYDKTMNIYELGYPNNKVRLTISSMQNDVL